MNAGRFRASTALRASISTDGLVLLDVNGGLVLASNPVGARIWELLAQGCDSDEIARRIAAEYDVSIERAGADLAGFVSGLLARGLLTEEPPC